MSIVFFGTTDTGYHCLEQMLLAGLPVAGIVTGLPEFEISYAKGRVQNRRHRDFHLFQERFGVPVLTFTRKFDEAILSTLARWQPQLLVVIGWYHLIPARVRALAPLGTVGIHWSLLPKYRGGSPLVWAIINGERETGASLFYLEDKVDTGRIIAQTPVAIGEHENIAHMIDKLNAVSAEIVVEHVPEILQGTAVSWPQDEAHATYFRPRLPEDGLIDWRWPARRIYNFIRAQTLPYPCAFSNYHGQRIRIVSATLQPQSGEHVRVCSGDGGWLGLEKILGDDDETIRPALPFFQKEEIEFDQRSDDAAE